MDLSNTQKSMNHNSSSERMPRNRRTTLLAWSFWTLVMVSAIVSFVLRTWNIAPLIQTVQGAQFLQEVLYWGILTPLTAPAFGTVGAIIASRRPNNSVGWICLALGLVVALQDATWQYGARALEVAPGSLPAGLLFAMMGGILGILQQPLPYIVLLLVFPDGHSLSPRWRLVAWAALLLSLLGVLITIIYPTIQAGLQTRVANPLGIKPLQAVDQTISTTVYWLLYPVLLVAVVSLVVRWRRARETERQQLKWPVYTGMVTVGATLLAFLTAQLPLSPYVPTLIGAIGVAGASIGIPVAIGIAILRHRLYDIDRLINRTLVYGLLTAILAVLYAGLVLGLQASFNRVMGPTTANSPLILVGSTLVIATLFHPLRRRLQSGIDRRFYRSKYNARRTIATFSARLRGQFDLADLSEQLVAVVEETMQPTTVSLWLRQPTSTGTHRFSRDDRGAPVDARQVLGSGDLILH